jgi:hypothetical protein
MQPFYPIYSPAFPTFQKFLALLESFFHYKNNQNHLNSIQMKLLYLYLFIFIFLTACGSPRKALERGEYHEAVLGAIKKLKGSPDNEKAMSVLQEALPLAVGQHQDNIDNQKRSTLPFRWEKIADSYGKLQQIHEEVRASPVAMKAVGKPKSYIEDWEDAKKMAAAERYEAGNRELAKNTREYARAAYEHFETAQKLVPNYRDSRSKMEQAIEMATLKVVVERIPVYARNLQLGNEYFQNKMDEYLAKNERINRFVRFYSPEEMQRSGQYPEHQVRMVFDEFEIGQTYIKSETIEVESKDSVQVGEATLNGKKIAVYNKVKAKLSSYRKKVVSKGLLDMQIIELHSGRVLLQEKMPSEYVWGCEWANFNGDERALTNTQKENCKREEIMPPPAQELFLEFGKPIFDQATNRLRNFYRNY